MNQGDPFGGNQLPTAPVAHQRLTVNDLSVEIHMPPALVSKYDPITGDEIDQGLPPGNLRPGYRVDEHLKNAPEGWRRSDPSRKAESYMTVIRPDSGLWLNFNQNDRYTHDVAAVVSVQGVNAITGQAVTGLGLEQYVNQCPVHGTKFGIELHCDECGFKWPNQNYVASTASGGGFWLDGFRAPDGAVRQYVFTTDVERGVAQQILGPNQQEALGIIFYRSRNPKPVPPSLTRTPLYGGHLESLGGTAQSVSKGGFESVQVAAGARIKQQVHRDPKDLSYWEDEPHGMLYIYYATEDRARVIMGLPPRNPEGFLGGLKTGHPGSGKA